MMKQRNNIAALSAVFAACIMIIFAQSYSVPTYLSPKDVAEWVISGGQIASGSAVPTAVASHGAMYIDTSVATAPALWRYDGSDWRMVAGGGGVSESLAEHVASHTDPHGATMTVTESLTVGNGTTFFELVALDSNAVVASGAMFAIGSISEYANNAAAIASGLATGTVYRSGDDLKIVW